MSKRKEEAEGGVKPTGSVRVSGSQSADDSSTPDSGRAPMPGPADAPTRLGKGRAREKALSGAEREICAIRTGNC